MALQTPPPPLISQAVVAPKITIPARLYPVNCRGIELLGVSGPRNSSDVSICVHQLSVELWKRYDTPRATVQKKIEKLDIQLQNLTREQVLSFRKEGIIEGFRATAITADEADRVFDALEESRDRRGLQKHKLHTNQDRNLRREEVKINKAHLKRHLTQVSRRCNDKAATPPIPCSIHASAAAGGEGSALNRTATDSASAGENNPAAETSQCGLFVAEDSYQLPDLSEEGFPIELVKNVAAADPSIVNQQTDSTRTSTNASESSSHASQLMESVLPSSSESLSCMHLSRLGSAALASGIRSPSAHSSDQDEQASHSGSSVSPSGGTTPNKSSPERFLFLESEESGGEEGHPGQIINQKNFGPNTNQNNGSAGSLCAFSPQYRGIPHKGGKGLREIGVGSGGGVSGRVSSSDHEEGGTTHTVHHFSGPKHRRVKATKLRHYAKTTSPSMNLATPSQTSSKLQTPLLISIPLSSLSACTSSSPAISSMKHRRPTALSHFAMKKRALSRSPSTGSNHDMSPVSSVAGVQSTSDSATLTKGGGGGKGGKQPKKSTSNKTGKLPDQSVGLSRGDEIPVSVAKDEMLLSPPTDRRPETTTRNVPEDDEMSVASSNTTATMTSSSGTSLSGGGPSNKPPTKSNQASQRGGGGGRRSSRGAHGSSDSLLRINSNFSLQSLFSYCPPTLVVRNGELVPEKSLSIKDFDQFSLPSSHPISSWSLGQPVPGRWTGVTSAPRAKRPRKMTNQSSKV